MSNILHNRYQIQEPIGEGGEYIVYLGTDIISDQTVVIKRKKDSLQSISALNWQREAQLLEQIHLDCVARCLDSFVSRIELVPYGYLVQEYIDGTTLDQEQKSTRYTQEEVKEIILEILAIVIQLQQLSPPIIHRDLKPSNIIRRNSNRKFILLDFGLAIDQTLDELGHTIGVGSLGYQAPEQIAGYPTLSSDVYSIGVIAVELLGRTSPTELLQGQRLQWEKAVATVDDNWKKWLQKALEPEEKLRFQNASEAWSALRQLALPKSHTQENIAPNPFIPIPEPETAAEPYTPVESEPPTVAVTYRKKTKKRNAQPNDFEKIKSTSIQYSEGDSANKEEIRATLKRYRLWAIVLLFFGGGIFSIGAIIYFSLQLNRLDTDDWEDVAQTVQKIQNAGCIPVAILIAVLLGCVSSVISLVF